MIEIGITHAGADRSTSHCQWKKSFQGEKEGFSQPIQLTSAPHPAHLIDLLTIFHKL